MASTKETILDYYKAFDLDRAMDEKNLRKALGKVQRTYMRRQSTTNDKSELEQVNNSLNTLDKAIEILSNPDSRKKYDKELDKAYAAGMINDEAEAQARDALEKARQYFEKNQLQLAARFAIEAINNKVNNPDAYEILARCYFDTGDYVQSVETVDKALTIYVDNEYFLWLSARFNTVIERYDVAQQRINRMLEINPNSQKAHAEQIHFYMYAEKEDIAFQQIDQYIEQHPNDKQFMQETAYNLISFTNTCYFEDPETGSMVIADKASYKKCVTLCEKAYSIYQDEYTSNCLESATFYGQREFNKANSEMLKWLWPFGIFTLFIVGNSFRTISSIGDVFSLLLTLALYFLPAVLLTVVSFRPYWQINKEYYTGNAGLFETLVRGWSKITVSLLKLSVKLAVWLWKFVISLVLRA